MSESRNAASQRPNDAERLHAAVRTVCSQTGEAPEAFVEWLCNGGFVEMVLAYFTSPAAETARFRFRAAGNDAVENQSRNIDSARDPVFGGHSYEASMLRDLLARIHGDGGHYVAQHGLDKAIEDADSLVANWRASAPQASQPPQGAELRYALETALAAMLKVGGDSAMTPGRYFDDLAPAIDAARGALAAPPQGASSLLPADAIEAVVERLVTEVWTWGESCGVDGVRMNEQGDSHNEWMRANAMKAKDALYGMLAASPLPAPQEPARVYLVATGETHEGQETDTRHDTRPPLCDAEALYAAPAPQEPAAEPFPSRRN